MLHIDILTVGNEFKNDQGDIFKITSNMNDGKKGFVEYEKVEVVEPLEDKLIEE